MAFIKYQIKETNMSKQELGEWGPNSLPGDSQTVNANETQKNHDGIQQHPNNRNNSPHSAYRQPYPQNSWLIEIGDNHEH
jgi:hypothetical protein